MILRLLAVILPPVAIIALAVLLAACGPQGRLGPAVVDGCLVNPHTLCAKEIAP
ncbi:hypothetical protein LX81_00250 [Palleronia aestuarii]|uniref:Lipoprotein n=1 Tax=Palleronia aestuarii TaxID=568105 RepID=A0A2W7NHQ7_9RHOB|nr:hypothetical protein [Palleronia aestuarii]PZX19788.1 hypothetical protein LX81_00250 [Palleronia aestuarii]